MTSTLSGTSLNAARRATDLAAAGRRRTGRRPRDRRGVTGAGVALDAAARGLSVALVEAHDLAFGTSRWSSKLVHGGLRYLARGDVGLARESAVERDVVMRIIAPHLTGGCRSSSRLGSGLSAGSAALDLRRARGGDLLRRVAGTPGDVLPRPRRVSAQEALALVPGLDPAGRVAGCCRSTASSWTTRGWWSRSPGRPPGSARRSSRGCGDVPRPRGHRCRRAERVGVSDRGAAW